MVALIDYGSGNVRSVFNALKSLGADAVLTADVAEIARASGLAKSTVSSVLAELRRSEIVVDERTGAALQRL